MEKSLRKPPEVFQVPCFLLPPPIRSEWNKDRLINSRVDVDVAKSSQTPTKVNAVPQSEKREGEKGRRDGGGEKIWGSNASLMRLLVVSAVGAWHQHSAVSQPTKICSACRISAALFCLRPNTHAHKNTRQHTCDAYTLCTANVRHFSSGNEALEGKM